MLVLNIANRWYCPLQVLPIEGAALINIADLRYIAHLRYCAPPVAPIVGIAHRRYCPQPRLLISSIAHRQYCPLVVLPIVSITHRRYFAHHRYC